MSNILAQIAEIQSLSIAELRERWKTLYGTEAPAYSRERMIRRLCYRVQELVHGGLSDATRSALRVVAERDGAGGQGMRLTRRDANSGAPAVGTVYVRMWRDERHEVTATQAGFEYRGQLFRTLSAIAKKITNAHWNGLLFFGLRDRKKERR